MKKTSVPSLTAQFGGLSDMLLQHGSCSPHGLSSTIAHAGESGKAAKDSAASNAALQHQNPLSNEANLALDEFDEFVDYDAIYE